VCVCVCVFVCVCVCVCAAYVCILKGIRHPAPYFPPVKRPHDHISRTSLPHILRCTPQDAYVLVYSPHTLATYIYRSQPSREAVLASSSSECLVPSPFCFAINPFMPKDSSLLLSVFFQAANP